MKETCCGNEKTEELVKQSNPSKEQMIEFLLNKDQKASERLDICKQCPKLQQGLNVCTLCGCFMNIKVRIYSSHCPLGKW